MVHDEIRLFQKLDTQTAFGVDSIIIGDDLFITFAYIYGKESDVFKWKDGKFVKDHALPATGTDVDAFIIDGQHFISIVGKGNNIEFIMKPKIYLLNDFIYKKMHFKIITLYAGTTSRDPFVYFFKYNGKNFTSFNNVKLDSRPYGITYVKARDEHFLAVAFYDLPQSVILKWNGETFEIAQEIGSSKVRAVITLYISKVCPMYKPKL